MDRLENSPSIGPRTPCAARGAWIPVCGPNAGAGAPAAAAVLNAPFLHRAVEAVDMVRGPSVRRREAAVYASSCSICESTLAVEPPWSRIAVIFLTACMTVV